MNRAERDSLPIGSPQGARGGARQKLDAAQLELLLGLEDAAGKAPASPEPGEAALLSCKDPSRPSRPAHPRGHEPRWPADLPVIEQVIEPAEGHRRAVSTSSRP